MVINYTFNMHSTTLQNASFSEMLNTALQLYRAGRFAESEMIYQKLITLQPDLAELHKNHGNALLGLGRLEEAEQSYCRALALKPDFGEAYNNLGNVLRLEKRLEEAVQAFHQALTFLPDCAEVYNNLGNVFTDLEQFEDAEQVYRKALVLKPDFEHAYNNRGNSLMALERWHVAEKCYRQAIACNPNYSEAYNNLGLLLVQTGKIEEAEKSYRQAISLNPDFHEAYNNLALLLVQIGRMNEAEQIYLHALTLVPDDARKKFNLSLLYLLQGRFEEGFELYEQRLACESGSFLVKTQDQIKSLRQCKLWEGELLNGKSLLILTEQGAGDNLMMMRYLPLIKQRGTKGLIVVCEPHLKRLFQSMSVVDEVITTTDPLPIDRIDSYCTMMSLPYIFRTRLESIPVNVPYLFIPTKMKNIWQRRLKSSSGLKVGLVWAGNRQHLHDKKRSIELKAFEPLVNIGHIQLVSLQKGEDASQLKDIGWDMLDWMDKCDDYLDTASLISNLDLVISVDTSVAHLAGALGKPVWLLNRLESEWRWMLNLSYSPWYPSMKIFRQINRGDWNSVILQVAKELSITADSSHRGGLI